MKKFLQSLVLLMATVAGGLALSLTSAVAFSVTITVDENGNGTLTNTNGFNSALSFSLMNDAGPGGLANAVTYDLQNPPGLTSGDLIMLEPGSLGAVSDIIRFNSTEVGAGGGLGTLVFYSDNTDGVDSKADIGFPTAVYANSLGVVEVGPEGNNGFTYTPTAGQPGFVSGAGGSVTYDIISDSPVAATPIPAALPLFAAGLGALGLFGWRRKRNTQALAA